MNIREQQITQFERDVDAIHSAGREPFFNDGTVLLDFYVDYYPPRDMLTFSVRPTPTTHYTRRNAVCGNHGEAQIHLPMHLTAGKRDPVDYYSQVLTCSKIAMVSIDVSPANVAVQQLLGDVLRPDWYIVRLFFGRIRGINGRVGGGDYDAATSNVLMDFAIFATEVEFKLLRSLGNQLRSEICHLSLSSTRETLERLYIDSRKTQFSFCLIVSRCNYLTAGSTPGARLRDDYASLDALRTQWSSALEQLKIDGWHQRACDELRDMRWVIIVSGPWRTREVAKQTIHGVFTQQNVWYIDGQASELFEPRAPNFIITTASLGNGQQRTYCFARNPLRHFTWRRLHDAVLDAVLVLAQINLPPYVILDIINHHKHVWPIEEILKVRLIESVSHAIRRVRARQRPFDMQLD